VVFPQPASATAAARASATLSQRLVFFFKIPYLDEKRGVCRGVNEMIAVAGRPDREQKITRPEPFAARLMTTEV
jgi:hypothetical protein